MTAAELFAPVRGLPAPPERPVRFGAVGLGAPHVHQMCRGLLEAGAELLSLYDPDPALLARFCEAYPQAKPCGSPEEVLADPALELLVCGAIPAQRAELAVKAMEAGKDVLTDKAPMIRLEQAARVREVRAQTGRHWIVFYGESIHDAPSLFARDLIARGVIGKVLHVEGTGPHRLFPQMRADWFYEREKTGGILTDLVCHQIHQFLEFTGAEDAVLDLARVANFHHPQYGDWDDFGDCALTASNGATGHFRVDWFTPDGLSTWGDGRMTVVGTEGYVELRKYCDVAREQDPCNVYVVNGEGEFRADVTDLVDLPFFRRVLRDCLDRTCTAQEPERAFRAIELAIAAQDLALQKRQ